MGINSNLNEWLNGYDNGFGSGLRSIGSDPHLTGRIRSLKRVRTRRLADSQWQQAGSSGPMAAPLLAKRVGEKRSLASWASIGIWPMAKREIGKCFSFLFSKSFSKFATVWIQIKFKLRTTSTRKIKYKSTLQHKRKFMRRHEWTDKIIYLNR
jgi:hypothetical protein